MPQRLPASETETDDDQSHGARSPTPEALPRTLARVTLGSLHTALNRSTRRALSAAAAEAAAERGLGFRAGRGARARAERQQEDEEETDQQYDDTAGKAMTTWWIKLTLFTALNSAVTLALFPPTINPTPYYPSTPTATSLQSLPLISIEALLVQLCYTLRGVCAVSGMCVGLGYYTFASLLSHQQTPSMFRQLYLQKSHSVANISYPCYLVADFCIHCLLTGFIARTWAECMSARSVALAWLFHRLGTGWGGVG